MRKCVIAAGLMCVPMAVVAWQGGMAAIGITEPGLQSQLEQATRQSGDGLKLPSLESKALAAARALSQPEQVALARALAVAARTIMMSPAFQSAHDAYIAKEYKAVNHGIKAKSLEQAARQATSKAGVADFELKMKREMAALYVQMAMETSIDNLTMMFESDLKDWTRNASNVKRSDRAKYAKLARQAQATQGLSASDPDKFRRSYAVLKSAEAGGLDTEEALFGAQAGAQAENEQIMWDKHNLRGALKRVLAQVVAEAPTVDFGAETVQKDSSRIFVNPAYEKKSLTWKAMYRAGKGPTAAGLEIARAWLKEL